MLLFREQPCPARLRDAESAGGIAAIDQKVHVIAVEADQAGEKRELERVIANSGALSFDNPDGGSVFTFGLGNAACAPMQGSQSGMALPQRVRMTQIGACYAGLVKELLRPGIVIARSSNLSR